MSLWYDGSLGKNRPKRLRKRTQKAHHKFEDCEWFRVPCFFPPPSQVFLIKNILNIFRMTSLSILVYSLWNLTMGNEIRIWNYTGEVRKMVFFISEEWMDSEPAVLIMNRPNFSFFCIIHRCCKFFCDPCRYNKLKVQRCA